MTGMRGTKFGLVALILGLVASGFAFASTASASSVGITDLRMYNGSTQVSPASAPAGSQRGFWLQVKFTNGITGGQKINITGPTGASFSTNPGNYVLNWPGTTINPSAATALSGGQGVQLTVPAAAPAVSAGDSRYVTFGGGFPNVSLTGVGTEVGSKAMTVSTTNDVDSASSPTYEITPGPIAAIGIPGGGAISATVGTTFSSSGQVIGAYDAYGNPIPGQQIDLSTPNSGASGTFAGGAHTTSVTMLSGGQAVIPATTANTVAGSWNMTASASGAPNNTIPRVNTAAAPSAVSVALSPTSIVANGTSHSTATATVTDTYGNKVAGQTVTMSASGPTVGAVTSVGDGTYTAQLTSSTTAGSFSVTATDTTPNPDIVSSPATLTQTAGPATQIIVPSAISTTVNTAFASQSITVRDANNNPVPSQSVSLSTPNSGASGTFAGNSHSTTVTTNASGVASIPTTTASTTAGSWSMTASISGGPSNTLSRTNNAGAPSAISLGLNPNSIVANGSSQTTATATVTDSFGNKIAGQTVTIGVTGPSAGAVTNVGDGTYTAPITSSIVAGTYSVTATDTTPNPDIVSSPVTLTQTAGPATQIVVPAGISTTVGTQFAGQAITVRDANGNPVSGQQVNLSTPASGASGTFAGDSHSTTVTTNASGVASIPTTTASTTAGSWSMTATISGGPGNTLSRTNDPGAPASVSLSLNPASLPADGTSHAVATATVSDSFGNPVSGQAVNFTASGGQATGSVNDHGDGTYSANVTSTTTPGSYTVAATDITPVTPISSSPAALEQTVLHASEIRVTLDPSSIRADGTSTTTATVTVSNVLGNPVSGEEVAISSNGGQQIGAVTETGAGTYSAQITASTVAGQSAIKATDSSPATAISATATLTQTSIAPPTVDKPVLKFVKPPKKKVKAARVKFRFKVVKGEAKGFQCKLDRKKWAKCKSPKLVKLKRGKHTFQVRGIATDGTFGKPVKRVIKRVK